MKRSRVIAIGMLLGAVGGLTVGCGGVRGSHSVSPASFFLPGLMHHEAPAPRPDGNSPTPATTDKIAGPSNVIPG